MKKKILKFSLKLIISALFLFWVIFKVNWLEVWEQVSQIRLWQIILYLVVVALGILVSAYKWKILADFKKFNNSLWEHFNLYLAGTFINNFMPSFIGGDTYKAYEIGKKDKRFVEAASTVMMDRITGLFGATILTLAFSALNWEKVLQSKTLIVVNIIIFASFLFDITMAKIKHFSFWGKLARFIPEKISKFLRELGTYNNDSHIISRSILWAFLFDFIGIALSNYLLFLFLGIKISLRDYMSVVFLISVISSVPVSINNIGIKEWAYIAFFGVFNLPADQVVTVAILSRLLQMLLSFGALPTYLKIQRERMKEKALREASGEV